jgi:hypothetical protein
MRESSQQILSHVSFLTQRVENNMITSNIETRFTRVITCIGVIAQDILMKYYASLQQ